jgi:hypothetical protein
MSIKITWMPLPTGSPSYQQQREQQLVHQEVPLLLRVREGALAEHHHSLGLARRQLRRQCSREFFNNRGVQLSNALRLESSPVAVPSALFTTVSTAPTATNARMPLLAARSSLDSATYRNPYYLLQCALVNT